jgi:hypothetical protein
MVGFDGLKVEDLTRADSTAATASTPCLISCAPACRASESYVVDGAADRHPPEPAC